MFKMIEFTKSKDRELTNIILITSGEFISIFGTRIYNFAIAYYLLKMTGSVAAFSISLAIGTVPRIFISPFAGAIVDTVERKKVTIFTDIARWLVLLLLYFAVVISSMKAMYIYITVLFLSAMDIFFDLALGSSIPNIVHKSNIIKVNSIKQTMSSVGSILAPSLGGVIIAFIDIKYFILANAISFLISGISQYFVDYNIEAINVPAKEKLTPKLLLKNTAQSFAYIKTQAFIMIITTYSMVGNFLIYLGFVIPMPYIVLKCLNINSAQYGIIQGSISIGAVVTSIFMTIFSSPKKKYKLFTGASLVFCMPFIMLGIVAIIPMSKNILFSYMVMVSFSYGIGTVMINIPTSAVQQEKIENSMLGRVLGFQGTFGGIITPVSMLLAGNLLGKLPPYVLPLASGIMFLLTVMITCSNKVIREI